MHACISLVIISLVSMTTIPFYRGTVTQRDKRVTKGYTSNGYVVIRIKTQDSICTMIFWFYFLFVCLCMCTFEKMQQMKPQKFSDQEQKCSYSQYAMYRQNQANFHLTISCYWLYWVIYNIHGFQVFTYPSIQWTCLPNVSHSNTGKLSITRTGKISLGGFFRYCVYRQWTSHHGLSMWSSHNS